MAAPTTAGAGRKDTELVAGRFHALDDALARPGVRMLSVDVFDTLLCRRVPKPTDAHLLLGRRLADRALLRPHLTPALFARLRIMAEEEARRRRVRLDGSSEVTLLDICDLLTPAISDRLGPGELASLELEHERAITFADAQVIARLRSVPDGLTLIAVSDTYFSGDELRALFRHHDCDDLPFAHIITSSDVGVGKGAGLWKHVISDLRIDPSAMVHVGDNPEADVRSAERAGIFAVHLPVSSDHFGQVLERERLLGGPSDPSPWCDERDGDGGLTAIRRRATFLAPPVQDADRGVEVTWATGTAVLGPAFAGFAQWVHERGAALGAERALCVMREGRFLQRVLEGATRRTGRRLRTRTVWASREGCARASIYDGSEAELRMFLARLNTPSPRQVIDSLGLDPDLRPALARLAARTDDVAASQSVVDLVLDDEELLATVTSRSRTLRQRLVAHLLEAAGPGAGPVVVVDVGWAGSILESLQRMLDTEQAGLQLHGLYLLAHIGSAGPLLRGVPLEGYLGDSGFAPFDVAGITGNPELIELATMCDDGSFLEIAEDGTPTLAPAWVTPRQRDRRNLLQDGIAAFQELWDMHRDASAHYEISAPGRAMMRRILERFLSLPTSQEVEAFAWWGHEENFGSDQVDQLVPPALRPTLHLRTADNLHHAPPNKLYWVGGAASIVDPQTAEHVFLMRRGAIGPGWLTANPGIGEASVALVGPDGSERPTATIPLAVNRRGLCFLEWSGDPDGSTTVRLRPCEGDAVLRLDWVRVEAIDAAGTVTACHDWAGEDLGQLTVVGAGQIAPHTYAVDGASRLVITAPEQSKTASLRVQVAGAFLPVPRGADPASSPITAMHEVAALRRELTALRQTKVFRATAVPRKVYGRIRRAAVEASGRRHRDGGS